MDQLWRHTFGVPSDSAWGHIKAVPDVRMRKPLATQRDHLIDHLLVHAAHVLACLRHGGSCLGALLRDLFRHRFRPRHDRVETVWRPARGRFLTAEWPLLASPVAIRRVL